MTLVVETILGDETVTGVDHWPRGEPEKIEWPRRFALHRWYDLTGQSGTGIVAYGTVYPSGRTTLAWCCGDVPSISVYDSPEQVERIHGHSGHTDLVWLDPDTSPHAGISEPGQASANPFVGGRRKDSRDDR